MTDTSVVDASSVPVTGDNLADVESQTPSVAPNPAAKVPADKNGRQEIELTDQTNLLPFRVVILIFIGLTATTLLSTLDSVIVATALPTIAAHFHASSYASWVPSAYLMTSTAFQPLYGRFSDIFGRKAALVFGVGVFMVGCLAAGFSQSMISVIICRGVAGAGGGSIVSVGQIILSDVVTLRDRGKYVGYIGGFMALGYAIGPILGGVLAQKVSWRWCFWITLPLAFVALCLLIFVIPLKPVEGNIRRKLMIVDYVGAILTLGACTLIILPLIWGGATFPWSSAIVLGPLCAGIVLVGVFCLWEWKGARLPIVPMYIFKHITVTGVYIAMFVNGFVFFSSLYYLPQFFQVALGYSPTRSGTFLLPILVSQVVSTMSAGLSVSKTGKYRMVIHIGFSLAAIGSGLLSTVDATSHRALMVFYMVLAGLGNGMTMQTTTVAAQASVARRDMSVVTAVRNFTRMLGGALSLAVDSTIINNSIDSAARHLSLSPATTKAITNNPILLLNPSAFSITQSQAAYMLNDGYTKGFHNVFILNAALAAGAVVTSYFMIKHKELIRPDEAKLREEALKRLEKKHEHPRQRSDGHSDIEMNVVATTEGKE